MQTFHLWMNSLNSFVWGPALIVLILGTGLYLQILLGGMPVRKIGAGLRLVWRGRDVDLRDHSVATRQPRRPLRRRQDEMSCAVELEHQPTAEDIAGRAVGLGPRPGLADLE